MGIVEQYLLQLNTKKQRFRRHVSLLTVLSLLVMLSVSWNLRQTGITLANDACCGMEEHRHSEECPVEKVLICGFDEEATEETTEETMEETTEEPTGHVHSDECYEITYLCGLEEHTHDFSCYPDLTADLENWDIWAESIPELTGNIGEDIVLVAQSQLGITESTLNFELADDDLTRNGITRYGQWYGNPYGAWSNMFTSFCLRYAGLLNVPINSGAEAMRIGWEEAKLYRYAGGYEPVSGDIVFLDKNLNGTAETTAVVVRYFDFVLTVIEGDVDNAVAQLEYRIDDPVIVGYGMTNPRGGLMFAAVSDNANAIGHSVKYTGDLIQADESFILYTVGNDGKYYAIDGNGKAVEIKIDAAGEIYSEVEDPGILYWKFSNSGWASNSPMFSIVNASTGKALHPYNDGGNNNGVLHNTAWQTVLHANDTGVKLRGNNQNWYARLSGDAFTITDQQNNGSVFYFGEAPSTVMLWLDGTNGNIMSYRGSDNTKYTVYSGMESQLPSEWKSPTKYSYKLAGWVNIENGDYYLPGDMITIEKNTVLYADWVASTYDIGQFNNQVADTISTNDFITTYVFDYSSLINLNSTKVNVNVSDTSHSETWSHVGSGNNVTYKNQTTLDFSFNDHDTSGTITNPNSRNAANEYTGGNGVRTGLYSAEIAQTLFGTNNLFNPETGEGVVGKHYLGQGDHLFQINTDPNSEYYGYYYYDAKLNAASYNQSDQRFYVYEYLARTTDSANNNDAGKYSDFLPLNSPYANTNSQALKTYNYAGENGEYTHVPHYVYDARYDSDGSTNKQIKANLWFGMRVDVKFVLPNIPNNTGGNKDIYGNDMRFKFTGDDDVWILIDGQVVLDLGGIHQAASGEINFSTGEVWVNGNAVWVNERERESTVSHIPPGTHTLSILYLERGSSMSNCSIYFNLAPQYDLTLQKEDVLTGELLDGAVFAFYEDAKCETPCVLYTSQEAFNLNQSTYKFTVENGKAYIWGLNPSHTYYIREESPPTHNDNEEHPLYEQYSTAKGVIRLTLDKKGVNSNSAVILEELDENGNPIPISEGFTIHDFRIDDETQSVYLTVTNAQNWITETTSVYVKKYWDDTEDHSKDSVTVYLNVTENGKVNRIREAVLSKENNWSYHWTNLPKYPLNDENTEDGEPLVYTVTEAYVSGYVPTIAPMGEWQSATTFESGQKYLLRNGNKYLSATDGNKLALVDESVAKNSNLALWTATVTNNNTVSLINQAGQILRYDRGFVIATTGNHTLSFKTNNGIILYNKQTYLSGVGSNGNATTTNRENAAMVFQLEQKFEIQDVGYVITNTPLSAETSLRVHKQWDKHGGNTALYEKAVVTVKLLANGEDTGRTETISLKSNWSAEFAGLPYLDEAGEPIKYMVEETWETHDWTPTYGLVTATDDEIPTYDVTITNVYRWANARVLPSTGGIGYPFFVLCGLILVLAPLVYGLRLRRRYRKGAGK